MVAWFKSQYPNHTVAAWSSSGVIHPVEDFKMFDVDIMESTSNSSLLCAQKIRFATDLIDEAFTKGSAQRKQEIITAFGGKNPNVVHGDFMFFVADIFTMWVQYGRRTDMCDTILSQSFNLDPIGETAKLREFYGLTSEEYDAASLSNTTIDFSLNLRQWTWQYCTEFAWFQTPNDQFRTRSPAINLTFWTDYCRRIYDPSLPDVNVTKVNEKYGGLNITGKNIFFFNAIEDPWQYAGLLDYQNEE